MITLNPSSDALFAELLRKNDGSNNSSSSSGNNSDNFRPTDNAAPINATTNASSANDQQGNVDSVKTRSISEEKTAEQTVAIEPEDRRAVAERAARDKVHALGLSGEVADHAINAAGNAASVATHTNIDTVVRDETAKTLGISPKALADLEEIKALMSGRAGAEHHSPTGLDLGGFGVAAGGGKQRGGPELF